MTHDLKAAATATPHLQALHHAWHDFMLEAGVLSLSVLPDCDQVNAIIASRVAWDGKARPYVCVQVQLLAQGEVE